MSDFINIDIEEFQRKSAELLAKYQSLEKKLKDDIAKRVLEEAGQIFLEEQRRILSQRSPKLASLLEVWVEKTKNGWQLNVGFPGKLFNDITYVNKKGETKKKRTNVEAFIIEYGRPGTRGMKKGGKDSIKRKIGKVEPYSYIRASKYLKGETVMREIQSRLDEELTKYWNNEG